MKINVLRDVAPNSLEETERRFRGVTASIITPISTWRNTPKNTVSLDWVVVPSRKQEYVKPVSGSLLSTQYVWKATKHCHLTKVTVPLTYPVS
jgi:hypothetical protein